MIVRGKLLLGIVALCVGCGLMTFRPTPALADTQTVFAQAAETENVPETRTEQAPASLPHGKFLLDYLLVALLLAGAMYAVCRSSRRV